MSVLKRLIGRDEGDVTPVLTLAEYRSLTAHLPRATAAQMESFARFVSNAHSWYKHVPLFPPSAPLHFFIDPSAGTQRAIASDGSISIFDRDKTGFHYSWIPTMEYRRRFGYLAFSKSVGSSVSLVDAKGGRLIPSDDSPLVYEPHRALLCGVPVAVVQAGTALMSGIVHTLAANVDLWRHLEQYLTHWPPESGGAKALLAILGRCRLLRENPSLEERLPLADDRVAEDVHLGFIDYPLHELISPERKHQQHEMVAAMRRALDMISPAAATGF